MRFAFSLLLVSILLPLGACDVFGAQLKCRFDVIMSLTTLAKV